MSIQHVTTFQVAAARSWIREAKREARREGTRKGRFGLVGYWMAFNALYWLWALRDSVKTNDEMSQVKHLLGKLPLVTTEGLLTLNYSYMRFLVRRGAIRSMKTRSATDELGSPTKGASYLKDLESTDPRTRLQGLVGVLYLIRCNLMHGAKKADEILPRGSVPALRSIVEECLTYTEANV